MIKPFTPLEFFQYEKEHGMTSDFIPYLKLHYSLGEKIKVLLNPKTVLEIGAGAGALLEYFLKEGIDATAVDHSIYHKQYFESRNPQWYYKYVVHDLADDLQDLNVDVIVSIECFEHLEDKVLEKAIDYVARNCKYFVFSSTPIPDPEFDVQWGHVNVKPTEEWIKIFEDKGMKLKYRWDVPTEWTLVFISR